MFRIYSMFEDFLKLIDDKEKDNISIFLEAVGSVPKEYVQYYTEENDKKSIDHVERVFAYELYRRWADLLEKRNSGLKLNAEIPKNLASTYSKNVSELNYPDMVLHKGQGHMDGNHIVCEIKRAIRNDSLIIDDIDKWKFYLDGYKKDGDEEWKAFSYFIILLVAIEGNQDKISKDRLKELFDKTEIKKRAKQMLVVTYYEEEIAAYRVDQILNSK